MGTVVPLLGLSRVSFRVKFDTNQVFLQVIPDAPGYPRKNANVDKTKVKDANGSLQNMAHKLVGVITGRLVLIRVMSLPDIA